MGLISGDIEYAMLNASIVCWNSGDSMPLPRLDKEINDLVERIKFVGQSSHLLMLKPLWQTVHNFQLLSGDSIMDHDALVAEFRHANPSVVHWSRFHSMHLAYCFGDYDLAEEFAVGSHNIYDNNFGAMDTSVVLFYECIVLLATARKGDRKIMRYVRRLHKRLQDWAIKCPSNFLGKQYFIEAEIAMVKGGPLKSIAKYYSAILHSREGGFIVQEALANERMRDYTWQAETTMLQLPFSRKLAGCIKYGEELKS